MGSASSSAPGDQAALINSGVEDTDTGADDRKLSSFPNIVKSSAEFYKLPFLAPAPGKVFSFLPLFSLRVSGEA